MLANKAATGAANISDIAVSKDSSLTDSWIIQPVRDADTRTKLVFAAGARFSNFGYAKTTIQDLAAEIGFSKAYFYRFFRSKQEIGEMICATCFQEILDKIDAEIRIAVSCLDRLRRMLRTITAMRIRLHAQKPKLYDVTKIAASDGWEAYRWYCSQLAEVLREIIAHGRKTGEFERKTPIDEVVRSSVMSIRPLFDPRFQRDAGSQIPSDLNNVTNLILRSLAP
jgi:AcrR family transcriptional regulator